MYKGVILDNLTGKQINTHNFNHAQTAEEKALEKASYLNKKYDMQGRFKFITVIFDF